MKVALLSDLHANIYALKSVLEDLDKESVDKIIVSGDLIGYYYWPGELVAHLMSDERFICIRGNHENILKEVLQSEEASDRYRVKYGSGYDACREQLELDQFNWLFSLPEKLQLEFDGVSFHIGHGGLLDNEQYIYPDAPKKVIEENASEMDFTVFGHTHYPCIHYYGKRHIINPGSVGQPRDVGGLASYVIINTSNSGVSFKRKRFDVNPLIRFAQKADPDLKYLVDIMSR